MINVTGFKERFKTRLANTNREELLKWFDNAEKKDIERRIKELNKND